MNRRRIHHVAVTVAIGALPATLGLAVLAGGAASAQFEPTTECSTMAHPPGIEVNPGSDNPLTRPGQLGGLTQPPAPGDMPMDCPPIGHG